MEEEEEEEMSNLHILMVPWLAMGHLIPLFELSKRLALKKIQISFFSTPSNILRLPSIPQSLTPFLKFIPCSPRSVDNLPFDIENTIDLHSESDRHLLIQAFDALESSLIAFLSDPRQPKPNWIIHDFLATNWAPSLASRFNINSASFNVLMAAAKAFLSRAAECGSPEEIMKVPDLLPFATAVNFSPFEARRVYPFIPRKMYEAEAKPHNKIQLKLIRTCKEFETKWLDLLGDKYTPIGFLRPSFVEEEEETETWGRISEWLDKREDFAVIYAAFGTEVDLAREQIDEIGLGLERSGLPFVWVLRAGLPPPLGFEERTAGRGMVWMGWVPQARLLAHRAVGGFLTHGGPGSLIEGMAVGAAMVVLPMKFEHGLNARHLAESGYAAVVERDDEDGSFCGEDIARKLRMVMVEEEGEELRKKAREGKEIFGSEKLQEEYIDELVKKLWEKQELEAQPV